MKSPNPQRLAIVRVARCTVGVGVASAFAEALPLALLVEVSACGYGGCRQGRNRTTQLPTLNRQH
jgi:hypothetical protein